MISQIFNKAYRYTLGIVSKPIYTQLFLLNLVANSLSFVYFNGPFVYSCFILLAAIIAFVYTAIIHLTHIQWLQKSVQTLLLILTNIFIIIDIFLLKEFNLIFGEDVINIIADTNPTEISNFATAYFGVSNIAFIISITAVLNLVAYYLPKLIIKIKRNYIFNTYIILCCGALLLGGYTVYNLKVFGTGLGVPQYASAFRYSHSALLFKKRIDEIVHLRDICKNTTASTSVTDNRIIVLVIGESHSKFHSSTYDYPLPTNPLLNQLKDNGELHVYNNAITPYNATHAALKLIFPTNEFASSPLFPCIFKKAGYNTHIYENQYMLGKSMNFLTDKSLSDLMFTTRNDFNYVLDEALVDSIQLSKGPALYILHLQGQHYTYKNRYSNSYAKFTSANYDTNRWTESQREIIAHYDNATLYNDYILNSIINKFRDQNSCVVYFSDHGEEIYEVRDYMGHGDYNGDKVALNHQIQIPFYIWVSDKFKTQNPNIYDKIITRYNTPITSKNISHLLMGLAEIKCSSYNPKKDFLNEEYDSISPRYTLKSVDYDNLLK